MSQEKVFIDPNNAKSIWDRLKALIPTKLSQLTNDAGYVSNMPFELDNNGDIMPTNKS